MDRANPNRYLNRSSSAEEQHDESETLLGGAIQENPSSSLRVVAENNHHIEKNAALNNNRDSQVSVRENEKKLILVDPILDVKIDPSPTAYEKASTINVLHYFYVVKYVCKLRNRKTQPLNLEDTPRLGRTEEVSIKILELETEYQKYREKHKMPSLFWPLFRVFWPRFAIAQMSCILWNASQICFILFLSKLLEELEAGQKSKAYIWAVYLFLATLISVYSGHFESFQGFKIVGQLRLALIGIIYRKVIRLSSFSIMNQMSTGNIINIAANDLNILESQLVYLFAFALSPFVLAGSLAVLWSLVGVASIPGIAILFLMIPIQSCVVNLGAKYVGKKNLITDEKIKRTNEMIEGVRLLKMYGWNTQIAASILNARSQEANLLTKIGYCDSFGGHLLARLLPIMSSFLIFVTYDLIGGNLTGSKVYSTLLMVNFLRLPVTISSSVSLRLIVELKLALKRIMQLLEFNDVVEDAAAPLDDRNRIEFENFSAFWGEKSNNSEKPNQSQRSGELTFEHPTLKRLNFSVKSGTLCALIGKVGSGKTTTLMSLLNEVPKTTGYLRYLGRIAYVEQEPSIFPGTVRSNIIFGRPYDEQRYNQVIEATCLLDEFKEFPLGDLTEIGERGVNLSGGQRSRISLARALYFDADIYLLDDPLSAVDAKVAKNIFRKAIRGILKNKTVLLATHQIHFAEEAEQIVVLENGEIKAVSSTIDEIIAIQDATYVLSIFKTSSTKIEPSENDGEKKEEDMDTGENQDMIDDVGVERESENDTEKDKEQEQMKDKLVIQEKDEASDVGWVTYWFYIKNVGSFWYIIFFAMNSSIVEIFYVMYTYITGYWAEGTWTPVFAIEVLAIILVAFLLSLILRETLFVNVSLNASKSLYRKMLWSVIGAKVEFFDTNPAGRILNRFSNDVGVLDRFLLLPQSDVLDAAFFYTASLTTMCLIVPWLIIPVFFLILLVALLVKNLTHLIIQGRGLELLTRSPILILLSLTLPGLTSIRVYGQENQFIGDFTSILSKNARAFNFYYELMRVLQFYSELISWIFGCFGVAITLLYADNLNTSLVGLICYYLLSGSNYLQYIVKQCLTHLMLMTSTARIKAYIEIQQEAAPVLISDDELLKQKYSWPSKGEIRFNNVSMKYRQNTDKYVLKGFTFEVNGAEKIGCVGRTGAGKTSIIQTLFRMVEIDKQAVPDSSITIDGIDISKIGLLTLRKNISIIPQTPFLFMGTVRKNIDPLGEHDESELIQALQETDLWNYVKSLPEGFDTNISNASPLFSAGQKQLLCLARVLLQKNKILVLDEATSNVDFETDNFIQHKIMERFSECTVFTIAHRLSTIAHYDRVMVMDKGKIKEFDHPYRLLTEQIGDVTITKCTGTFASMVLKTGSKGSELIFQAAKNSYFKKFRNLQ